jgi:hypothetical protein
MLKRLLAESITHVEDLPVDEFIDVLRNMGSMVAQEKLDGANLWIGLDEDGKFFTSREGKKSNAERRYSAEDWPKVSSFNQFRAAHAALEQVQDELRRTMRPNDMVEVEVLFGRQPNSVVYGAEGKSYIAFIRGINNTPDTIADHLEQVLQGKTVDAKVALVDSEDGQELVDNEQTIPFQFTRPQQVDPAQLKSAALVDKELQALEKFLRAKSSVPGFTNNELAQVALTAVPKEQREAVKAARTEVLAKLQTEFKLPIKAALLDKVVRQVRSKLTADDLTPDEDVGIEGIVLRDPASGKQIKIVDKDVFTAINRFNQSVRGSIQGALNTTDPDASLESRGGLIGALRLRIAEFLGNRELAKASNVRKLLEPIKGESPEAAIKNLAASMPGNDDPQAIKRKILAMIADTAQQLAKQLEEFKGNKGLYRLKLKNGKELGLSPETVKKTLVFFAEARRNLTIMFDKIKDTKSLAQVLAVLYGSAAKAVHAKEDVTEGLLLERKGEIDIHEYERKDAFELYNSYIATMFMAMVIFHTSDVLGLRRLRDRRNYLLKKHHADMSPLNHWGYVIWRAARPELKKHLTKKTVAEIQGVVKRIQAPWWKFMHMDFSYNKEVKVNWADHKRTLGRLIELAGLRSERLNTLLDLCVGFDGLSYEKQLSALKKLNAFAHRFVPRSSLYIRTRDIESKLKDRGSKEPMVEAKLLKSITALAEEGEGGGAPGGMGAGGAEMVGSPVSGATTASAIASLPVRIGMNRRVEKRTRNPEVATMLKKFKDPRKQKA